MQLLTTSTFALTVGLLVAVGLRLLLAARRTRGLPEALIGAALFSGGLGFALRMLERGPFSDSSHHFPLWIVASATITAAPAFLAIAAWRMFRPGERWAGVLALLAVAGCVASWLIVLPMGVAPKRGVAGLPWALEVGAGVTGYAWAACESFLYYRKTLRQRRLGLVEPLIVEQFKLYATGAGLAAVLRAISIYTVLAHHRSASESPLVFLLLQALAFGAALCLYVAFFPPAGWARRVAARHPAAAG